MMKQDDLLPIGCFQFDIPELCRRHQGEKKMTIANACKRAKDHTGIIRPIAFQTWQNRSDKLRSEIHQNSYYVMHAEGLKCGCIIYHYEGQWKGA